jgi:hypothetical protein
VVQVDLGQGLLAFAVVLVIFEVQWAFGCHLLDDWCTGLGLAGDKLAEQACLLPGLLLLLLGGQWCRCRLKVDLLRLWLDVALGGGDLLARDLKSRADLAPE